MDAEITRALQLAIGAREDRIRAEKALEVLKVKENQAADALAALAKGIKP